MPKKCKLLYNDTANTADGDRYCGTEGPPSMTSTNNVMTIVFASDHSVTTEGFQASYTTVNATSCMRSLSYWSYKDVICHTYYCTLVTAGSSGFIRH